LQTCLMIYHWHTKLLSIRLELFISPKCLEDVFNFFGDKLMIPIVLFWSLWMFSVWLVFTSNLNSQSTWLKVKLRIVNLLLVPKPSSIQLSSVAVILPLRARELPSNIFRFSVMLFTKTSGFQTLPFF